MHLGRWRGVSAAALMAAGLLGAHGCQGKQRPFGVTGESPSAVDEGPESEMASPLPGESGDDASASSGSEGAPTSLDLLPTGALGSACAIDGGCNSGFCVAGRCCDGRCDGVCEACSAGGRCQLAPNDDERCAKQDASGPVAPTLPETAPTVVHMFDIELGTDGYLFECDGVLRSGTSGIEGQGPVFGTRDEHANGVPCTARASTSPDLTLTVMFAGFLPSEGLPMGVLNLAEPSAVANVRIRLGATYPTPEVPVGTPIIRDYGIYQSFGEDPPSSNILVQLPNLQGTVVARVREDISAYEIELTDVTLALVRSVGPRAYPSIATVRRALVQYRR